MKIGVICDGDAEVEVLRVLLGKVSIEGIQLIGAAYADMQPMAPPGQVVAAARSRIDIWRAKNASRIIVAIDRERSVICPGERAESLRFAFHAAGYHEVEVVVKDRKLENWLIADAEAVSGLNNFSLPDSVVQRVHAAGADSVNDAQRELERAGRNGYSKRRDALRIAAVAAVERIELRSRSFRRFLRHAGHPAYALQSRYANRA